MTIQRLHQLVRQWTKQSGVKGHFGTHSLRKTYGYHLRRLGADIVTLMKVFGHSSQSITLRYIGIEQEEIDEANLRLNL
jgi:site-specific recombinase XerD